MSAFCASSSSLSLELDAYTLTLRLNPEPQTPEPRTLNPSQRTRSLAAINGYIITAIGVGLIHLQAGSGQTVTMDIRVQNRYWR